MYIKYIKYAIALSELRETSSQQQRQLMAVVVVAEAAATIAKR